AFHVPSLDRAIKTRACQLRAIGCEGQPCHPLGMSRKDLHLGTRLRLLRFPHPDTSIGAATGELLPIGAPGQRVHYAALTRKCLSLRAAGGIPQLDEGTPRAAGEHMSIRSNGHTEDTSGLPALPEQHATLHVPQLDRVIPTHADQGVSVRAEGKCKHTVDMGLPDQLEDLACLCPHPHLTPPIGGSPALPGPADGDRCDGSDGL